MPLDSRRYDIRLRNSTWDRLLFRVEHRVLSPGRDDMARLRGYLRTKAWRDCETPAQRLRAVLAAAKLPLRALRDSWHAVGTYGGPVEKEDGVSRTTQLRHLWWLWVRHGVLPEVYYGFRLHREGQLRRAPRFFQGHDADNLFRMLSIRTARDEAELMLDKSAFERWLVEHGLPTVRTLAAFQGGAMTASDLPDGRLPRASLFSKPNDALQGLGTEVWHFDGTGWTGADGRRRTENELLRELGERSGPRGMLLQERLVNHPAMAPLAPNALSTIRVVTVRGLDGQVRVVLAVCKIPTGTAPTDHMRVGGVAAPVDLATGRLGVAITKDKKRIISRCERHPDTGVTFDGFQLPEWESVKALAVRAHGELRRLFVVGWDIAILPRGPIIIEGNDNPGSASAQMPTGIAYGETEIAPTLAALLDAAFAREGRSNGTNRAASESASRS